MAQKIVRELLGDNFMKTLFSQNNYLFVMNMPAIRLVTCNLRLFPHGRYGSGCGIDACSKPVWTTIDSYDILLGYDLYSVDNKWVM